MRNTASPSTLNPLALMAPGSRLFIDTNVFMDTDPRRVGGVKRFFERIAPEVKRGESPIVIPTKVREELKKQSGIDTSSLDVDRAEAVSKARNALKFLDSAQEAGLIRGDLGDASNPYADDLFVDLFEVYATTYQMFLLTNDITLLVRISVVGQQAGQTRSAGRLNSDGLIECDAPQVLFERGLRKLSTLRTRREGGSGGLKDDREIASLEESLDQYRAAYGTVVPADVRSNAGVKGGARVEVERLAFSKAPAFKGPDEALKASEVPGEGDEVHVASRSSGYAARLGEKLGEGGEGAVYSVSDTQVIKVFNQQHLTRHREEKIRLLASRGFTKPGICFPEAVVTNRHGEFVGYVMPRARGKEFSRAIFNPRRFRSEYPAWTKSDLVDVGISFLEKVTYLHSLNIIVGDINPKNLQVDGDKQVWVIDADSWQLEGYPCPVGTEMFSSPTVIGRHYSGFLRTGEDENFAIATMLFMILITGQFPYARAGSDGDIARLIREGRFAFQYKENSNQDQPNGNWRYMWSHLQAGLKGMFWDTFHRDGSRYENRPTAEEWLKAFHEYRRYLSSSENFDPMSNDVYPTRFKAMAADTPIYECAVCAASMVGRWSDEKKAYSTPRLCTACASNLPRCGGCGKHRSSLQLGLCYPCFKQKNYGKCEGCGRDKRLGALKDGRCYECNLGTCTACDRSVPVRHLVGGVCDRCRPVPCIECAANVQKSELSYGRCPRCAKKDLERQSRALTIDPSRLCQRCGKPFMTYGNVEWHTRHGKAVPTSHKRASGGTYPSECVPVSSPKLCTAPKGKPAGSNSPGGCFVATAVYGSYDSPEVWVLRRWRDGSLAATRGGRVFVHVYYAASPPLVALVGGKKWFTTPVRIVLDALVKVLMLSGLSNEPYCDTTRDHITR